MADQISMDQSDQNELCLLVCWVCTLGLCFNLCNVFAWGAVKSDKVCDEHSSARNCENKSVEYGRKRAIFDLYFDVQSEPVGQWGLLIIKIFSMNLSDSVYSLVMYVNSCTALGNNLIKIYELETGMLF